MLAIGVATLIFFQAAVNIGMNLNLLPVSGLPLPFVSYGGSGLTALMIGIGFVQSVVMRQKELEF
ncbi:MAG: FtsW/RodA/SpoVE family cell cycle protein, partial [bacterium]|nr:FtsW/RodA/SpoVE family cell cycle protein [Anaerolineales bacterium]MDP1624236.1 FtsW/RodA/SpoVE family cell cycle protein [bacterium]